MVIPYEQDLHRALEGPVHFVREQRGEFTLRCNPHHVADSVAEIAARRVRQEHEARIRSERVTRYLMSIA